MKGLKIIVISLIVLFLITTFENFNSYILARTPSFFSVEQSLGISSLVHDFKKEFIVFSLILMSTIELCVHRKEYLYQVVLTSSILLFLMTYFGSFSHLLQYFKPRRFLIPFTLLLLIPSSRFIWRFRNIKLFRKKQGVILLLSIGIGVLYLVFHIYAISNFDLAYLRSQISKDYRFKTLTTELDSQTQNLLSELIENTDNNGRILLEDSPLSSKTKCSVYGGCITELFPTLTNRQFITSDFTLSPSSSQNYLKLESGNLFRRPISSFDERELEVIFKWYNIKWVVSWSNKTHKTFINHPNLLRKISQTKKFEIWQTSIAPNFFIKGTGNISLGLNRISISKIEGNEIIIRYNYYPNLKSIPRTNITRYNELADKLPNIWDNGYTKIDTSGLDRITLYG